MFATSKVLPLVMQLGNYLKTGVDHYATVKASGVAIDADLLSIYLHAQMSSWDPVLSGNHLIDEPTRAAAARFLAGVAVNVAGVK